MDNKFLHKVVDQIMSETRIDYDEERLYTPSGLSFSLLVLHSSSFFFSPSFFPFYRHCRDVYGLNKQEIEYVWDEYRNIIKDKINN